MSLRDLSIKHSYNSEKDDILNDFYIPSLKEGVFYDRIAGYFSSSSFTAAAEGICQFARNQGRMRFIVNVKLSMEDYDQIEKGLTCLEKIIQNRFLEDLEALQDECKKNHAKVLGWLIANNYLEIKVGYIENKISGNEILHQKVGVIEDKDGNKISFSGSNNESAYGWEYNSEKFKVFFSWETNNDEFIREDVNDFEELWNDESKKTRVVPFPEAIKKHLIDISPKSEFEFENLVYEIEKQKKGSALKKQEIGLRNYQLEAIDSWFKNGCKGLFEMATGTGKTYTALGALKKLLEKESKLVTIISCPFLHLTYQWEQSIKKFDLDLPIIFVSSSNTKWRHELAEKILDNRLGKVKQFIIITTHDTISSENFIQLMCEVRSLILFIGDEVHGMGSVGRVAGLLSTYNYRLGLSATPNRYFDELGTETLLQYFDRTVYSFDLSRAINEINPETGESYLAPYEYHPVFVELTIEEMEKYSNISAKIAILYSIKSRSKREQLALEWKLRERQDIIKNSENKYTIFKNLIKELADGNKIKHTLVYCSPQQIEKSQEIIRSQNTIIQHKFTSEENAIKKDPKYKGMTEREYLLDNFDKGIYDVLVAIKCLDEGVDIPSTRNAVIMCSSGNPKEYIQRRGRVLRRYPGKEKAVIYDITALPNFSHYRVSYEMEKSMIETQLRRIEEFSKDSLNEYEIINIIFSIKKKYGIL
ncbi:DEAD/DEAH box helicase family protein [Methanosarcina mazei]|uniref:DEAD/DEAH box helicase family protein n=1 Tax=Methanosarcina mazei TaxID=2209 RepID=UPI003C715424